MIINKRSISRIIIFLACLILGCFSAKAQTNFVKQGLSFVAVGDYKNAKTQFEGERAVLISKKVSQNSDQFIAIEKKIAYADECFGLSSNASKVLDELNEASLQTAFANCSSEDAAEVTKDNLLAKLETAEKAIKKIAERFPSDKVNAQRRSNCAAIRSQIGRFRDNFSEVLAWRALGDSPTEEALESFLENYPNGGYSSAAKEAISAVRDEKKWAETKQTGTMSAYRDYLSSFKNGKYADEAKGIVEKMGEDLDWAEATERNTAAKYQEFIKRYPTSRYLSSAKSKLAACQEQDYWNEQVAQNTVKGYRNYLNRYPKGQYATTAQLNIDKIYDKKAWDEATLANTIEAYQSYLQNSKKKAYRAEAEKKIKDIRHEQEVAADEKIWASIAHSNNVSDFTNYLNSSSYKGHKDEATGRSHLLRARNYEMNSFYAEDIIKSYNLASKYLRLDPSDIQRRDQAREIVAFKKFDTQRNIPNALNYLSSFPDSERAINVSDFVAKAKADMMTMEVTQDDLDEALSYAKTSEAKKYVTSKFSEKEREYRSFQRRLRTEPFHLMLGAGMELHNTNLSEIGAVLSFGGHSNRFNLEAGFNKVGALEENEEGGKTLNFEDPWYSIADFSVVVRPRINLIKKNYTGTPGDRYRNGKDYSMIYLYVAPEAKYFIDPSVSINNYETGTILDNMDFGIRAGIGVSFLDFSVGYLVNLQSLSFGLTLYLSNK